MLFGDLLNDGAGPQRLANHPQFLVGTPSPPPLDAHRDLNPVLWSAPTYDPSFNIVPPSSVPQDGTLGGHLEAMEGGICLTLTAVARAAGDEGHDVIGLPPGTKVFLACRPVDLCNGFDGLAAKARCIVGGDPFSGHLFLFRGKRGDYLKIVRL